MDADPTPGSVGMRLRTLRIERGLTQGEMARVIGVSRSAIAQWETDRAGQLRENLTRVARALEVSTEFLLHGDDKFAGAQAMSGDELALLRLYRECSAEDRVILLQTARRLAR